MDPYINDIIQINQIMDINQQIHIMDTFLKKHNTHTFYIINKNNKYLLITHQDLINTINNEYNISKILYPKQILYNMLFVNDDIKYYCELALDNDNLKIVNNRYWRYVSKKIDFESD